MTLRFGQFKNKTVACYNYVKTQTCAALTGCQQNVWSSVRSLSHLSVENADHSQFTAQCERGPSLSGWRENSSTSTYKDLVSQLTSVLGAGSKGHDTKQLVQTVSHGKECQKHLESRLDTLTFSNNEVRLTSKQDSSDSLWSIVKLNHQNINDSMHNVSNAELKSNADTTLNRPQGPGDDKEKDKPDLLDLERVKEYYIAKLPRLYRENEDIQLGLHHQDIIFENNYFEKQKIHKGLMKYYKEVSRLRFIAYFKFPSFFFTTVAATTHLDESCVKLHWRFYYIRNLELFTSFMYKRVQGVSNLEAHNFKDGISTFYLDKDGKIIKHQVDRLMPVQSAEAVNLRPRITSRLVSVMGLAPTPKTNFDTNNSFKHKTQTDG